MKKLYPLLSVLFLISNINGQLYKICKGGLCIPDLTVEISNTLENSDMVFFINKSVIDQFSEFDFYEEILKNYLVQKKVND